ncbi:MAG: hypothetical protein KDI19_12030 [Pseudomonadales bacterium]|nr:hypothetical protein [Pseudomonadales bacterium]
MKETTCSTAQTLANEQREFLTQMLQTSLPGARVEFHADAINVQHAGQQDDAAIVGMVKRLVYIARSLNKDLLFHNAATPQFERDPQPYLESTREVIQVHPGFFTLQGGFLEVFKAINGRVRAMADEVDAIEQEYPAVWPVRLFKQIDYFHEFPHQVILCAPVKDDFDTRKRFADTYGKDAEFETVAMDQMMAPAEYGLEPAVCDCCYYGLENTSELQNAYYTCYNKVFRNERSGFGGLDRLTCFSVRDIMFVGDEQFVLEARQVLIERLSTFLTSLQLDAKIETANDPFFSNDAVMKSVFQNAHRLKYELLARIPHLDRDIAVGSINFHRDFFGKAFNIETLTGATAFSGCIGVGMERLTYALYCQHGERLSQWPQPVLDYLGLGRRVDQGR